MAVVETIGMLLVLAALALGVVGVAIVVCVLACPSNGQQCRQQRTRKAERALIDIGEWEQQAILAELLRRNQERRRDDRLAPPLTVIDSDVLHVEDEPGRR